MLTKPFTYSQADALAARIQVKEFVEAHKNAPRVATPIRPVICEQIAAEIGLQFGEKELKAAVAEMKKTGARFISRDSEICIGSTLPDGDGAFAAYSKSTGFFISLLAFPFVPDPETGEPPMIGTFHVISIPSWFFRLIGTELEDEARQLTYQIAGLPVAFEHPEDEAIWELFDALAIDGLQEKAQALGILASPGTKEVNFLGACSCGQQMMSVHLPTVTPAQIEANKERARKPRPGAQGKKKPRKPKIPAEP